MDRRLITQIAVSILLILNSISLFINMRRTERLKRMNDILLTKDQFQNILTSELMKCVDDDTRERCLNNARILFNNNNPNVKIKSCEILDLDKVKEDDKEDKDNDSSRIND